MKKLLILTILLLISIHSFAESDNTSDVSVEWLMGLATEEQIQAIDSFIEWASENEIIIKRDPSFYLQEMRAFYEQHPENKDFPFYAIVKTVAVIRGSWKEKGKTEKEVFKETFGGGWEERYQDSLEARRKILEAGKW